jgi:citrate lyase subunit beta / citryl-CoA lyase
MSEPVPRSWLFVPGDDERKQHKALASDADALIFDLEDAVVAAARPAARQQIAKVLQLQTRKDKQQWWVRVNPPTSPECLADLDAIVSAAPDGLVLPKVSVLQELQPVLAYLQRLPAVRVLIIATETPRAVLNLGQWDLASLGRRLAGLTWGTLDLAAALGMSRVTPAAQNDALHPLFAMARSTCVLAAAAAQCPAIDTVYPDFRDLSGLAQEAQQARLDGFAGKLAIHPDQVPVINQSFLFSSAEVQWAQEVLAAFAAAPNSGAVSLNGCMLDRPHHVQAERIIARVKHYSVD